MLVRGAGEGFNFIVPVRRMHSWAEKHNVTWALDKSADTPTLQEIVKLPIEGSSEKKKEGDEKSVTIDAAKFPFLIQTRVLNNSKP